MNRLQNSKSTNTLGKELDSLISSAQSKQAITSGLFESTSSPSTSSPSTSSPSTSSQSTSSPSTSIPTVENYPAHQPSLAAELNLFSNENFEVK